MDSRFGFEDFQDPQTLSVSVLAQLSKLAFQIQQLREQRDAVAPRNAMLAKQLNQKITILGKERERLGAVFGRRLGAAKARPPSAR